MSTHFQSGAIASAMAAAIAGFSMMASAASLAPSSKSLLHDYGDVQIYRVLCAPDMHGIVQQICTTVEKDLAPVAGPKAEVQLLASLGQVSVKNATNKVAAQAFIEKLNANLDHHYAGSVTLLESDGYAEVNFPVMVDAWRSAVDQAGSTTEQQSIVKATVETQADGSAMIELDIRQTLRGQARTFHEKVPQSSLDKPVILGGFAKVVLQEYKP